jgi:hypothetical protein
MLAKAFLRSKQLPLLFILGVVGLGGMAVFLSYTQYQPDTATRQLRICVLAGEPNDSRRRDISRRYCNFANSALAASR